MGRPSSLTQEQRDEVWQLVPRLGFREAARRVGITLGACQRAYEKMKADETLRPNSSVPPGAAPPPPPVPEPPRATQKDDAPEISDAEMRRYVAGALKKIMGAIANEREPRVLASLISPLQTLLSRYKEETRRPDRKTAILILPAEGSL